ncbi:ATP-binding protein [Aquabacterium sp.]|uniref:ATP-binding protein n=1 Tax=Aquabacterium sp. TaxID=1872578 RepID=UPI0025BFB9F7|nr:ATP-binding protein [Aquabacterium sp.]
MLPSPDPARVTPHDPELHRLIQVERVRMLFGPTVPVALVSGVFAVALALLIGQQAGWERALQWVAVCLGASAFRIAHMRAYQRDPQRDSAAWLRSLCLVCVLHGLTWGLAGGWLIPADDLVTTAVVVAVLVGGSAISTLTTQAHMAPNLAINLPMLLPPALALAWRQDTYGWFGFFGLLALLGMMLFESRRAERRITELLWLRFTTDRIAQERAQALKLAQRHSAVKDQFLATMSHEMRTPLHGMLGLARLLQQRLPRKAGLLNESHQQLELIEHAGEHLLTLINDVLDFSRIEAGHLQVEHAPFELGSVVHDVLGLLRVTAAEKGLALETDIALPSPCWVMGDPARVRQMLHNLVGNAIKFTDEGWVAVSVQRPLLDGQPGEEVLFQVRDSGIGIPPDQLPRVFDAFHQVDGSFGRRHKGTGLGLTITREIARAMGGDIACDSIVGRGSVFTLRAPLPLTAAISVDLPLPLQEREAPAGTDPDTLATAFADTLPATLPAAAPPHVLLAEDNAVNALVAEASLANLGMRVTRVENGRLALAQLCQPGRTFDVVLMDCQMPELDGIEATRELRTWERTHGLPAIPVIALTANAMGGDRQRCIDAGMDDHLAKPFRQDELRQTLGRHLRAQAAAPALM